MDQLKDIDNKEQGNGIISKNSFKDVLKPFFKYKSVDELNVLTKMAEEDSELSESNKIDYKKIFSEESEDSITGFLIMFKSYLKEERLALAKKIKESLERFGIVTPIDLKRVINAADNSISDKNVEKIIHWCFRGEKQIDLSTLKQRIDNSCMYNYPKNK